MCLVQSVSAEKDQKSSAQRLAHAKYGVVPWLVACGKCKAVGSVQTVNCEIVKSGDKACTFQTVF